MRKAEKFSVLIICLLLFSRTALANLGLEQQSPQVSSNKTLPILNSSQDSKTQVFVPTQDVKNQIVRSLEESEDNEKSEDAHSILNIISWGVMADISLIVVRIFRGKKLSIGKAVIPAQGIHSLMMWSVIIMSAVAAGLIISENRDELAEGVPTESDKGFHYINGLIVLFLTLASIFTGPATMMSLKEYDKIVNSIVGIKWVHRVSGALLYLLAKANIITGVIFHEGGKWKVGVYIYLGILFAVHIAIQIASWSSAKNSNQSPKITKVLEKKTTSPEVTILLEAVNKGITREELIKKFPKIKWLILGNGIYDLTDWMHSGGNFIIQACIGREVGRYFYGNYALEGTKIKAYGHSAFTTQQLNGFYIGELSNNYYESILLRKGGNQEVVSQQDAQWKMTKITPVSGSVYEISFQNPNFQVKSLGTSLSWIGRHFRVSFDRNNSLARQYTIAVSLNQANCQLRQHIYKYFDEIMETKGTGNALPTFNYDRSYLAPQDSLQLFLKDYVSFKGLSNQICHFDMNGSENKFRIEGPLGRGLELTPDTSGTRCIICAGTGILPFLDFLNLFLWKTMYQLIKEKAGVEKAEQINLMKIPFDSYLNGLSIKFIGAFTNSKEVLGLDILKKLAEITKKYKTNNFEAMMKGYYDDNISSVNEDFSTAQFLRGALSLKEEKYYVCGPLKMNDQVPRGLGMLGVPPEKIMLV